MTQASGNIYTVTWDGTNDSGKPVSAGIYLYQLKVGAELSEAKKMILLR
jgi:flagellar hook assembly protein FlgD